MFCAVIGPRAVLCIKLTASMECVQVSALKECNGMDSLFSLIRHMNVCIEMIMFEEHLDQDHCQQ